MAANVNKVFLAGNLTRDPELRETGGGAKVCNFSIAVNRKFKQNDEWKTDVQYFNIIVWNKSGENCAKYLAKGKPVFVEGRLQNRSYETQDGQKRSVTEIVSDNVQFLGSRNDGEAPAADNSKVPHHMAGEFEGGDSDSVPF